MGVWLDHQDLLANGAPCRSQAFQHPATNSLSRRTCKHATWHSHVLCLSPFLLLTPGLPAPLRLCACPVLFPLPSSGEKSCPQYTPTK